MHGFIRAARLMMTMLIVGVISSLLTVGMTAIIVDRYIRTTLDQFHIPVKHQPLTLTSIWGMLFGSDKKMEGDVNVAGSLNSVNGALPVMRSLLSNQESKVHDDIIVSPDAISKSKEQLPKMKKEKIFATLIKKLPQEEWQRLSMLMESGLTSSEVIEVEQVLAKHLNDKEYEEMRKWMVIESKR